MGEVSAYGIAVDAPAGWDVRIFQRPAGPGETTHAVVHAGTFALPPGRGDYGSGAVERMGPADALVVLLEFHPDDAGSALFAGRGLPRSLDPAAFRTTSLQRALPGQAGHQVFFTESGRAFCLYVVLGSIANRARLVAAVNALLPGVSIGASDGAAA